MAGLVGDSVVLGLETEQGEGGGGGRTKAGPKPSANHSPDSASFSFSFFSPPLFFLSLLTHRLFRGLLFSFGGKLCF